MALEAKAFCVALFARQTLVQPNMPRWWARIDELGDFGCVERLPAMMSWRRTARWMRPILCEAVQIAGMWDLFSKMGDHRLFLKLERCL
jgi:hypothetical protein